MFKNRIYKPTPVFWRGVGDSILYGLGTMSLETISRGETLTSLILIAVAMVGKFLSNLPVEKKHD